MVAKPQFGSNATAICIGGYIVAVGIIFLAMYSPGEIPAWPVRLFAMFGAGLIALRCARLDVEGK